MATHIIQNNQNTYNYEYVEKISENYLKIVVDSANIMWIHDYYVDQNYIKLFVIMLKRACDQVVEKHKCTKHMQHVTTTDWNYLKENTMWKIEYDDDINNIKIISCNILDVPHCITSGFFNNVT